MATVLVLMAGILLLALGGGVALATAMETAIAASYRDGVAALYAADAGAGVAIAALAETTDWAPFVGPYASGRLDRLLGVPDAPRPPMVTVSVIDADRPDRLVIVAAAEGSAGARRTVRVTVAKAVDARGGASVRVLAWQEVR